MGRQWRQHKCLLALAMGFHLLPGKRASLLVVLAGVFLLGMVSCGQSTPTSSPSVNHLAPRNHVPPAIFWRLVQVTFTTETTYAQANTLLRNEGVDAYPMINPLCGDLRDMGAPIPLSSPAPAPTPMSLEALQADFQFSHRMLVQTDAWPKLNRVAAEPAVVSVDPFPLPKNCPAHAPL